MIEDDNGQALPDTTEQVYPLEGTGDTLNQIEQTLLTQAQQRFVAEQKKTA